MTECNEVWQTIPGFPNYAASSEGRIRNTRFSRILVGTVTKKGYCQVSLRGAKGRRVMYVHRLVAAAFFGMAPPGFIVVTHLDGNRLKNQANNLKRSTRTEHARHSAALGHRKTRGLLGEANPNAILTTEKVREMRALRQQGVSLVELGKRFGVTTRGAHLVVTRATWKQVS